MEMLVALASIKRLFLSMSWAQFGNCITIIHLKAIPLCSALLLFPLREVRQKANMLTVDCTVRQVNKEKSNTLSKNLIHMLSGSVAGEVICASCLQLAESGRRAAPVLLLACFVSCAFPLLVVCVGWLPVRQGPSQPAQTAVCQFYYSYCCLAQWGKAALLLPLALILLPSKFVSGILHLSLCSLSFSRSAYFPMSQSLTLSPVFSPLAVLYLLLSLCLSLYLPLSLLLNED